jgi:hypothetical protein
LARMGSVVCFLTAACVARLTYDNGGAWGLGRR